MKKKIERICIIADAYPTKNNPKNPFIEQLVIAFTKLGINCTVINPVSITQHLMHKNELPPIVSERNTDAGVIKIYSPRYMTFSSIKKGLINTNLLNAYFFRKLALK